jgi:hypothetical protein
MTRPVVNITPRERLGRILVGLVAIVGGVVLFGAGAQPLAGIFEVLLVLAGADLAITGALGHCPLYARLGHAPVSPRRS